MKEPKYRAYSHESRNMYWFDVRWGNTSKQGSGYTGVLRIGEKRSHGGGINGGDNRTLIDLNDYILLEYTGLKDKNGEEIFEGDIVQYSKRPIIIPLVVIWDENSCSFRLKAKNSELSSALTISTQEGNLTTMIVWDLEVIGNIYENPELLKEEEKC